MSTILKKDSFVNFKKINFKFLFNENKISVPYSLNNKNIFIINENLNKQDFVLNVLEELRDFDNKNGTELFKNILYNDLKKFIFY
jgi:hypothetical protein